MNFKEFPFEDSSGGEKMEFGLLVYEQHVEKSLEIKGCGTGGNKPHVKLQSFISEEISVKLWFNVKDFGVNTLPR